MSISGYKQLNDAELDAVNAIKELEKFIAEVLGDVRAQVSEVNERDLSIARTHFEDACSRVVKAVTRPRTPWE